MVDSQQIVNSVHALKQLLETFGKAAEKVVDFAVDTYHGIKQLVTAAVSIVTIIFIIFCLSLFYEFLQKRNSRDNNTNYKSSNRPCNATASCRSKRLASGRMHFISKKGEAQLLSV